MGKVKAYQVWEHSTAISQDNLFVVSWSVQVSSPRKQGTFGDAATGFPAKWSLRNERRNSIMMTRHYPDLGSVSDWSCRLGNLFQPIRSSTQIWKKSQEIVLLHVTSYKLLNFCINDFSWVTSLRQVGRLPTANGRYQISKQNWLVCELGAFLLFNRF